MKRACPLFVCFIFLTTAASTLALPNYIEDYSKDPFAKIKNGDCTLCHESATGGQRNAFGDSFADNLHQITPLMRSQFPDYFSYPLLKVNDTLTIHFSDPDNKLIVVQSGTRRVEVDPAGRTVDGKKATTPKE
ncbi:MAG TPA: hypothetical protein VGK48_00420 [Terriglobia bacterium]|jgi:hypothetical protein